jgi:predicted RNA-binding Zn ribbon-like protein
LGDVRRFAQIAGHPAIDFINTLGGRPDDPDDEYLNCYNDLLAWTELTGLLQPYALADLRNAATAKPESADAALERARLLREALDRLLRANLNPKPQPRKGDEATIRTAYLEAIAHATLQPHNLHLAWAWPDGTNDLNRPLWPIALAAVDLFQTAPLQRLAQCQHCRWLFLDTSRQRNRRWCSMNACGAIMKMRRYRAAHRP